MIRTLLTTTALVALLASGTLAQETTTPAPAEQPAEGTAAPAEQPATEQPAEQPMAAEQPAGNMESILATGYVSTDSDDLASNIIGAAVYSSEAEDAERIGEINDLVLEQDGSVSAAIIGVGGFLGIGEKNVAVRFSELQWVVAADDTERWVLATTREALEAAPAFEWEDDEPAQDAAATGTMVDANNDGVADDPAMAADPNAMAADPNAMAPADPAAQPAFDRSTLQDVTLTADELEDIQVYGPGDENLGGIGDVVLSQDGQSVEAVIIDFGGFLGIGTKQVAVAMDGLRFQADENGNRFAFVNVTREQLDQAVEFNADTFQAERDTQLLQTTPAQ